jgi:adenosylhomocysteine nucleosidase
VIPPLLFIAADPRECIDWIAHRDSVRPLSLPVHWARAGKWQGRHVIAIANGAGPERAHAAVNSAGSVSAVCNIGFCGALDPALGPGDIFIATEIRNGTRSYTIRRPAGPPAASGILASITHVARTALEKRSLRSAGARVVEMEAAGAARASQELGVPFYCVRAVSDLASEDLHNDFDAALRPDGRINVPRLIAGALRSPWKRVGELIILKQRSEMASKNLGDFLANCTF